MCFNGLLQVSQDVTVLPAQRLHHRQQTLDQPAACLAVAALTTLTPQHRRTQRPLGRVVGRLDPFATHERPQGRLQTQQISTNRRRLGAAATAATLQHRTQPGPLLVDVRLQGAPRQRSVAHAVPPVEHILGEGQQLLTNASTLVVALHHGLEVATQMGPAQLPLRDVQAVIGTPAVRADDADHRLAQQGGQADQTTTGMQDKAGHRGRRGHPQPAALTGLLPASFIGVLARRLPHCLESFGMGRGQRLAGLLLSVVERTHRQGYTEQRLGELSQTPLTDVLTATQIGQGSTQTRAMALTPHRLGNGSVVESAAVRTGAKVALMLGEVRQQRRQFGDLVPGRFRIAGLRLGGQVRLAVIAGGGPIGDDLIHPFGRQA